MGRPDEAGLPVLPWADDERLFGSEAAEHFARHIAPPFLTRQPWLGGRGRAPEAVRIADVARLPGSGPADHLLITADIRFAGAAESRFFLPLTARPDDGRSAPAGALARLARDDGRTGFLLDATAEAAFALDALVALRAGRRLRSARGATLAFDGRDAPAADPIPAAVRPMKGEQSNSTVQIGDDLALKCYRRIEPGPHPELEMVGLLARTPGFAQTPPLHGSIVSEDGDGTTVLAALIGFVANDGDAATAAIGELASDLARAPRSPSDGANGPRLAEDIGRTLAAFHRAVASSEDPDFCAEPLTPAAMKETEAELVELAAAAFAVLDETPGDAARALRERRGDCLRAIEDAAAAPSGSTRIRLHGDMHLGQFLLAGNEVILVDYEGEPGRTLARRRRKESSLRDVAGMLRSFAYAAETATWLAGDPPGAGGARATRANAWADRCSHAFRAAYAAGVAGSPAAPPPGLGGARLLHLHAIGRALYEITYDGANRPEWVGTPARALLRLLQPGGH